MNCSALEGIDTALKLANKLESIAGAAVHNEGKVTKDCLMHIVDVLRSAHLKEGNDSTVGNDSVVAENDMVNHPHHYQSYNPELQIECIDAMRAAYGDEDVKSFCLCNAFKYLFRCYDKGRNEDIKKAQWYLDKFMELGGMDG